ncbi:MAG: VOC family protein [Pseudomonadota bacterium]|jgi:catechol 2,3-dioxygenase-like lactoylglutathione lyase family enzyme|nr:MAG: glyoxalase/bleomycin resistance/extradiol dioxygenase family protein [Pseudomonadota bacterium]HEX5599686.1 VOC family protein [Hyphomicrobiaceae bacterium]
MDNANNAPTLDHIGLQVSDFARAKEFYSAALQPLGIKLQMELPNEAGGVAGFGRCKPEFWIAAGKTPTSPFHIAFHAANRAQVDAFYKAAIAAGARDNGAPGLRPQYHPNYYGAFVIDPDGHNVEAVCHYPE